MDYVTEFVYVKKSTYNLESKPGSERCFLNSREIMLDEHLSCDPASLHKFVEDMHLEFLGSMHSHDAVYVKEKLQVSVVHQHLG